MNRYVNSLTDIKDLAVAYLVPYKVFAAWRRFPYWHRWYWRKQTEAEMLAILDDIFGPADDD